MHPPSGQLIYENGPVNGTVSTWQINFGFVVSDTFTVVNNFASITELSFGAWLLPGDTLTSVEVSITSGANSGTSYFDQTVNFTQIDCVTNEYGYNVCTETGSFNGPTLNAGTYWVNLQNASVPDGDPFYWDENSGVGCHSGGCPSQASENNVGSIPSEAFTLGGSAIPTTTSLSAPGSATAGQVVTLAAAVQAQGGFPVDVGSVTFLSGTQVLGTVQVSSSSPGSATLLTRFGPGSYSLTAQYNGNDFLLGSTSTAQPLTVTGTEPTSSTLTATQNGSNYNFSLTVTGSGNAPLSGAGALENVTQNGLVIGSIPVPGPGTSGFQAVQSYPANAGPQGIAVGDFNGDGIPDLAITNNSSTSVSVLLGNADGSFQTARLNDVGSAPVGIVAWDFNGDGILDLAVANSQGVSILLGKGDGTFQPQNLITLGFGTSPWAMAVADFNGDGKADLAVTDANNAVVRILLGNGDGTFNVEDMQTQVGTDPEGVAVGDFNDDGIPDLAVTNFGSASGTNGLSILLGNGDGTFQTQVNYTTGKVPIGVVVGDFRSDGKLDLAIANLNDDTVGIFLGNGDGTFQSQLPYTTGSMPYGVVVADFNGDGKPDLAVSNSDDPPNSSVTVFLGNGDGTFQAQPNNYTVGANPNGLVVGDFNGDGAPDIATANNGGNGTASVLLTETTSTGILNDIPVYGTGVQMLQSAFTPEGTFYGGDTSNTVSVQGSGLAPTTTSVGGVPNPSTYLETVVFTATVTSVAGSPTGTVTFSDGTGPISGCSNLVLMPGSGDESTATCSTTTVPVGSNCITASYSGGGIFAASQSPCFTQTVNQASTTTTLTANPPSPSTYGEQVTFTATVTGANGGSPTGTVSFTDDKNPITGCTAVTLVQQPQLNDSIATCTTSTLAVGSHTIAGTYSGDTNFAKSTNSIPYQVQSIATTFSNLTQSQKIAYGTPSITLSGVICGSGGVCPPAGEQVTITIANAHQNVTIGNNGAFSTGTFPTGSIPASNSPYTITYTYAGDANFAPATNASTTLTVNKAPPTFSDLTPSQIISYGTSTVSLSGVICAPGGVCPPSGEQVTITIANAHQNVTIGNNGAFSTGTFPAGSIPASNSPYPITYTYAGDANFNAATSTSTTLTVNKAGTTISLMSAPNPSIYLQTVTITATVIGANGGSPTQTVSFTDNGNAIPGCGAVALTAQTKGSAAICQTTTLSVGTHSQIVATYSGDDNYSGGGGTLRPAQVVEAVSTTTVIKSSQNPSISMQPVTFTATVTTASGAPASGQVTFQSNGVNIPDCTNPATLVNGVASCTTQSLAVGSDTILASFNDPQGRYGSSSATLIQTVQATRTISRLLPFRRIQRPLPKALPTSVTRSSRRPSI